MCVVFLTWRRADLGVTVVGREAGLSSGIILCAIIVRQNGGRRHHDEQLPPGSPSGGHRHTAAILRLRRMRQRKWPDMLELHGGRIEVLAVAKLLERLLVFLEPVRVQVCVGGGKVEAEEEMIRECLSIVLLFLPRVQMPQK